MCNWRYIKNNTQPSAVASYEMVNIHKNSFWVAIHSNKCTLSFWIMLELCSVLSVIHTLSLGNVVLIFMIQMIYILWISWCINCTRCTCELDIFFLNFNFMYKSLQYQKLFAYNFTSSLTECSALLQILNQFKQSSEKNSQ